MKAHVVCVLLIAAATGCAPLASGIMNAGTGEDDVVRKTAKYFSVEPGQLEITDIEKSPLHTAYKTRVNSKLYNCTIYYGQVECNEPGGS